MAMPSEGGEREIIGISLRVGGSSRFSPRRTVAKRGFSDTRTDLFAFVYHRFCNYRMIDPLFGNNVTNVSDIQDSSRGFRLKGTIQLAGNLMSLCF